jgi:hypothetical protein
VDYIAERRSGPSVIARNGNSPAQSQLELAMKITNSNETRELSVDELNIVSGGGLFSLVLRVASFNTLATVYERLGGPDVPVGLPSGE